MYRVLALIFSTLVLVPPAFAQNVGTIAGSVRDSQGLAIPGATVTLANRVSQASQNTVSDQDGRYVLNNVPFGTYVLTVSLSGFAPAEQVVELRSSVPIAKEVQLKIGALTETVTVSADALLETSAAGSHVDIGASLIEQLPTATPTKQLSAMLLSAPGFIPSQNGRVHVRGSHGQIQYVVDGVPLTDEYSEAFANPLDPRYVKSAEVMTGGIPAEYGGKLAAVVDITSKSGLDEPRSVFGNATLNVGRFNALDGGVTVGGRISPRVGYFLSGGGNRTDRYLDPPTTDNFHNNGHAERFTGKLELRPTDADFVRAVVSVNGSHFQVPNRPDAQADGVDAAQDLRDNSQTVTWLHQFGSAATMDVVGYRRSADAKLDGLVADAFSASQDRSLDHQGINASVSATSGMHRFKAGVQYDRNPVAEHFLMNGRFLAVNFIAFDGSRTGQNVGMFAQDTITLVPDLHVSLGVRYDRYKLIVEESAVSPRVGVAYHLHDSGTVFRASYNRIFMPPFSENLLFSSSPQARALAADPNDAGEDVRSERQHAFEAGVQQALGTRARLDVAYYRKDMRNVADVDQFFDTTVTFPISADKGLAQGVEARLDVPMHHGVSGYVSLSRATILLTAPLSGGLFLGEVPAPGEQFYADHDQRWQSQFGMSFEHPSRRLFGSVSGRVDSGIPFELPDDFDARTFEDPKALTLVDLDRGRAKPRAIFDAVVGSELYRHGSTKLEAQAGVLNLFDKTYLLNFLSIFNGTHYGAPRTWTARLKLGF
jgi:outer membrane receptor protein involved in Fe transport